MSKNANHQENPKDYIINFRVSRATYEKVKDKARENRESISHLVRKVIEDGVEIIDDLSRELLGAKPKERKIISWAPVVLAADVNCANCGRLIKAGTKTTAGYDETGRIFYFCSACKK